MSIQHAERILGLSLEWSDEDWSLQWAVDLWYQALSTVMASRSPA